MLETLEDGSVDHVITDPPYSAHVHANMAANPHGTDASIGRTKRDPGFACLTKADRARAAAHFARVAKRWIVVFCDEAYTAGWRNNLRRAGARVVRTGYWIREGTMPQMSGDRPAAGVECFVIAHAKASKLRWNGGGRPAVYSAPIVRGRGRIHTTQKPLGLMAALVRDFADPDELVLDPFMGGATTGVAAVQQGRRFVGVERDRDVFDRAVTRLHGTLWQPSIFDDPPERLRQSGFGFPRAGGDR